MSRIAEFYKQAGPADLPKGVVKALELGGLGTLAAPSIYHLSQGKHDPNKKPSKMDQFFSSENKPYHAMEVAGLGALATPYIAPTVIDKIKRMRGRIR